MEEKPKVHDDLSLIPKVTIEQACEAMGSRIGGLTASEAQEKQEKYGKNVVSEKKDKPLILVFLSNFISMIVIGEREEQAVEKLLPDLSDYVRKLFRETRINPLGRWLLIPVSDKRTLQDVETLVQVRIKICSGETAE